jgi:V8-like Glu-specific endopeptidase
VGLRAKLCELLSIALLASLMPFSSVVAVTYGDPIENPADLFPEVVPIWFNNGMCTGSLIEQQVVLTAAHCVYRQKGPFQVSVGGEDLSSGQRIDVDAVWSHQRYDKIFAENDVALLHLVRPAGVARLAVLPKSGAAKPSTFTLLGWGLDQNDDLTGKLSKLKLSNYESYTRKTYKASYNSKTMIGAGRYFPSEKLYGGSCSGDSGGPLYRGTKSREVVGITSWGSAKGCTSYRPSVFVRVSYHVKTIQMAIKTLKRRASKSPINTGTRRLQRRRLLRLQRRQRLVQLVVHALWARSALVVGPCFMSLLDSFLQLVQAVAVVANTSKHHHRVGLMAELPAVLQGWQLSTRTVHGLIMSIPPW